MIDGVMKEGVPTTSSTSSLLNFPSFKSGIIELKLHKPERKTKFLQSSSRRQGRFWVFLAHERILPPMPDHLHERPCTS